MTSDGEGKGKREERGKGTGREERRVEKNAIKEGKERGRGYEAIFLGPTN